MLRPGPLLPRFELLVQLMLRVVAARTVALLMPGLVGPWRLSAGAGPGCRAARRATGVPASRPLTGCRPSRNTVRPAVPPETRRGPFPYPGTAGPDSFTRRVNEARLANRPACRSLRCASRGAAPAGSPTRPCARARRPRGTGSRFRGVALRAGAPASGAVGQPSLPVNDMALGPDCGGSDVDGRRVEADPAGLT